MFESLFMRSILIVTCALTPSVLWGQLVTFDDLTLEPNSFYNGSDNAGGFTSGGAVFNNTFTDFGGGFTAWGGWSYSNMVDVTTPGFGNQYAAYHLPGGGGDASANYGVAFWSEFDPVTIDLPSGALLQSARITNTTYAALSMLNGDSFAKQFGGATGNDEDYFLLTISGLDGEGDAVGTPVQVYLADYRFADNDLDFILDEWTTVDLTSLSGASQLSFSLESSDVGMFGINTPTFFALDNLSFSTVPEPSTWCLLACVALGVMGYRRIRKLRVEHEMHQEKSK